MTQEFLVHNSWLIALAVGSGLMLVWPSVMKGGARRVTPQQATLLLNQKKAVVVDIRDEDAFNTVGAIAQSKRIPIDQIKAKAASVAKNKDTPVIVVCQKGMRAVPAAKILQGEGYTDVQVLDGGIAAWSEAGLPLKKNSAKSKA